MSSFRACGMCPFNPDLFSEFDFAPTDRSQPEIVAGQSLASGIVNDQQMTSASAPADVQLLAAASRYAQPNAQPPSEVGLQSNAVPLSDPQSEVSIPSQVSMTAAHDNFHTTIVEHDGVQLANMALEEFQLVIPVNVADVAAANGYSLLLHLLERSLLLQLLNLSLLLHLLDFSLPLVLLMIMTKLCRFSLLKIGFRQYHLHC